MDYRCILVISDLNNEWIDIFGVPFRRVGGGSVLKPSEMCRASLNVSRTWSVARNVVGGTECVMCRVSLLP